MTTGWQPPQEPPDRDWRPVVMMAIVAAVAIAALIGLALIGVR